MSRRDLALMARRLHCQIERAVRQAVRDTTAVADVERATRERLVAEANEALAWAEAEAVEAHEAQRR